MNENINQPLVGFTVQPFQDNLEEKNFVGNERQVVLYFSELTATLKL